MKTTEVIESPILFSGAMVRAILEDRKTHTRRVLKPQPKDFDSFENVGQCDSIWDGTNVITCPYGRGTLWVRETFAHEADGRIVYRADKAAIFSTSGKVRGSLFYLPSDYQPERWKPSIFMPRWASRITLEVVSVRVERLQEISEADAEAEGVKAVIGKKIHGWTPHVLEFSLLWDSINGKTFPWSGNPWVWVVEFRRVK